jgi:FMN reductase [NAD(P)H]
VKDSCLEVILERRSAHKFKDQDVPQEVLNKVLTAALRAPTPGGSVVGGYRGSQPYSIIVVRDKSRRAQLNEMLTEGRRRSIDEAPVSLVFCVDTHRLNRWAALGGGAPHFNGIGILWVSLRATYTAAQNAVIAANSLGLGTQYIQEIVWQPYTTLSFFKLPKQVLPVAMLILGYPADRPPLAPSLPLEAIVHDETYHDPSNDEIVRYFQDTEEYFQDWLRGLPEDAQVRRHIEAKGVKTLAQYVSILTYTESFYKWRDDIVRSNIALSELE